MYTIIVTDVSEKARCLGCCLDSTKVYTTSLLVQLNSLYSLPKDTKIWYKRLVMIYSVHVHNTQMLYISHTYTNYDTKYRTSYILTGIWTTSLSTSGFILWSGTRYGKNSNNLTVTSLSAAKKISTLVSCMHYRCYYMNMP